MNLQVSLNTSDVSSLQKKNPQAPQQVQGAAQASGRFREQTCDDAISVQNKEVSSTWAKFLEGVLGISVMPLSEFL